MRPYIPALALAALALGGCREQEAQGAIPRDKFVLANVAVRSVPDTAAKGDSLRRAALKKYRVSEAELRRFVELHGGKPEYMAAVWKEIADSVQKRYDRTAPRDIPHPPSSVPPPQPPPVIPDGSGQPAPNAAPIHLPPGARRPDIRPRNERRAEPPPPLQPPPPRTEPPREMIKREPPPTARDVNGTLVRTPGDTLKH